jgi:hypothetical protein
MLHRLVHALGWGHHFLYATSGPSLGQWLFAHGAGGRPVAGAVRIDDRGDPYAHLRPGQVIEVSGGNLTAALTELAQLQTQLSLHDLRAVPVKRLLQDSGVPV